MSSNTAYFKNKKTKHVHKTYTQFLAGEANQTWYHCNDRAVSSTSRMFSSTCFSFPNCCITILVSYTSLPGTRSTMHVRNLSSSSCRNSRNREMKKDLCSSQEEIQFSLSGAKRCYGGTDSPFAGEMLVQVFQDIYYSSFQRWLS